MKSKRVKAPSVPVKAPKIKSLEIAGKSISKKKLKPGNTKLSKSDPDYFSKMGKISATNRLKKLGTTHMSELAKKSHPRKDGYHGGRPKKVVD